MFRTTTTFDKVLDKATSNLLLEVDLFSVLQLCDLIRQKDCTPKYALQSIKRKLSTTNPHTVYYTLQALESLVKNCGAPLHEEVASKEFMESMRDLAKTTPHENVREKILELLQTWGHAFRKFPQYRAVQDVVNIMKAEGAKFPPLVEADAMFTADTAPEWQDGGCCNRCRTEFGLMNRKHHCRACGQIFCGKCSAKTATLPKFGIEKEVRVCDSCFDKYGSRESGPSNSTGSAGGLDFDDAIDMLVRSNSRGQPHHHPTKSSQSGASGTGTTTAAAATPRKSAEELEQEENEQLALALAISQSEAEAKEREAMEKKLSAMRFSPPTTSETPAAVSSPPASNGGSILKRTNNNSGLDSGIDDSADPDLTRYLNRSYWEERTKTPTVAESTSLGGSDPALFQPSAPVKDSNRGTKGEQAEELDQFVSVLREQIDMFVNRLKSNSSRGRHISNDTTVQTLFLNLTSMHTQLLNYIHAQDVARSHYEGLQDKVTQARDAREALDSLRKEHAEEQRRIAEEAERQRQAQMAIKLSDMRQKKHQYLQLQQNLALQRIQEEQRQMQLRMEQQRAWSGAAQQPPPPGTSGFYAHGVAPAPLTYAQPQYPPQLGPQYVPQQADPTMQQQQQVQPHYVYPPSGMPPNTNTGAEVPPHQQHQYYIPQHQQQQMPHTPPGVPTMDGSTSTTTAPSVPGSSEPQQNQYSAEIANLIDF